VTKLQLAQFFLVVGCTFWGAAHVERCGGHAGALVWMTLLYGIFLAMFLRFNARRKRSLQSGKSALKED
jgi:hypothetical protein